MLYHYYYIKHKNLRESYMLTIWQKPNKSVSLYLPLVVIGWPLLTDSEDSGIVRYSKHIIKLILIILKLKSILIFRSPPEFTSFPPVFASSSSCVWVGFSSLPCGVLAAIHNKTSTCNWIIKSHFHMYITMECYLCFCCVVRDFRQLFVYVQVNMFHEAVLGARLSLVF